MVNLKQSFVIKPEKPTPDSGVTLSDLDQEKPITHLPTVYFYRPSQPFSFTSASQILRDSLSQVLVHFYPLAGRLHWLPGGRVRLQCNSAGAMFYEAESTATIDDFPDFAPTPELGSLVPSVDYTNTELHKLPLVIVQLTEFSCGGISLGLGISHVMVDGPSAFHFMSEWARLARGEPLANPPFLDRTALLASDHHQPPDSPFKHDKFDPLPLLIGQSDDQEERSKETTVVVLHVSKVQVEKIIDMANASRAASTRAYSRYEAVAGHVWRCASKARGHDPEQPTKMFVPVGFRDRVSLPKWYFGNAVLKLTGSARSGELVGKPLGYACSKIREVSEMVTEEYVRSAIEDIKRQPDLTRLRKVHTFGSKDGPFNGNPNIEMTSWLGMPLEGVDFGWGKEIYMGPTTIGYDGKCFLLPGRGEHGSVSVALRFQVAHVEKFLKFFYEFNN